MSNHSDTQTKSGPVLDFPDNKSIQTQASEWLAKLDAEQPSKTDLAGFKQWVNADPAHRNAFEELVEFWDDMNILTQAVLPREVLLSEGKLTAGPNGAGLSEAELTQESIAARLARQPFAYSRAAFATALIAIAAVLISVTMQLSGPAIYTTAIGEQRTIQLADQSTVQLNTNSRLEVDYSENLRRLTLIQGEAHFDVAHNPGRPFEVYAAKGLVRAIGTAFTVHIRKIDVEVIVTEGAVEVDRAEQNAQPSATPAIQNIIQGPIASEIKVTAGNKVTYDKGLLDEVKLVVATGIEEQLSWRQGMLLFKDEPLQKVVDEVSRYTELKIIIPERSARELKVGGLFKVGDTESLFEALREGFDIHVKEVSSDVVYLISSKNR